jgi:hypothetical protein
MGVSKESFCRLPQLWERVHLEIEKKRTDRILPPHARIHEPISLHGLRPSFFPFFPYPFLASRLCQISPPNLVPFAALYRESEKLGGGPLPTFVSTPYLALKAKLAERASEEK